MEEPTINYDVVSEFAGHQPNKGVKLSDAVKNIFNLVKGKSMQVAVKGVFIDFTSIEELEDRLRKAAIEGVTVKVYDENVGG